MMAAETGKELYLSLRASVVKPQESSKPVGRFSLISVLKHDSL